MALMLGVRRGGRLTNRSLRVAAFGLDKKLRRQAKHALIARIEDTIRRLPSTLIYERSSNRVRALAKTMADRLVSRYRGGLEMVGA